MITPHVDVRTRTWWPYLDLARGLAALLVALSHLRTFVFVDFHALDHPSPLWLVFYFVTGFGHQAVIAFFVLSGFLVGGAVVSRAGAEQWSWSDYAITRMTRLWTVLLPALLLTAFWDNLGIALTSSTFYTGGMVETYNSGPAPDVSRYSFASFVGNLAFLQTIAVPTFGSNGPLWSLANEFWYYLLFPLLFCPFATKMQLPAKIRSAAIALVISYALPNELLFYGLIWLFGVAAFVFHSKAAFARSHPNALLFVSGTCLAATLILTRTSILGGLAGDFAVGVAFAAMLLPLSLIFSASSKVGKLSRRSAEFSYTLYLVHFPIAAFLSCYFLQNQRLMPGPTSALIYTALLALIMLYAYGVYFLFERNTSSVRHAILKVIALYSPSVAPTTTRK